MVNRPIEMMPQDDLSADVVHPEFKPNGNVRLVLGAELDGIVRQVARGVVIPRPAAEMLVRRLYTLLASKPSPTIQGVPPPSPRLQ